MSKAVDQRKDDAGGAASDSELMIAMRAANGEAFDALFRRYGRLVYRVAADILRDAAEAEDVTQEVFLEVYRKAHLYEPSRGSVRVWFLQYAYHRTLGRRAALRRRAAYRGQPLDLAELPAVVRRSALTRDECRWVIRAGLGQLSSRQRATLELACFEELSLRDVAERLGVTLGAARHYYYRGLARLRAWARTSADDRPPAAWPEPRSVAASFDRSRSEAVAPDQPIQLMPRDAERGSGAPAMAAVTLQRVGDFGARRQRRA